MRLGSFCTGYGGLDMAVEAHFGATLTWYSEVSKDCNQLLAHYWPEAPNLGDLTAIDWDQVEPVDIMCAGFPCQPFSHAGKREGANDERAIFAYIADGVSVLRPGVVVLENVAGLLTLGGPGIVGTLTGLGYDLRWGVVRASDAGAPHRRARWFCIARSTDSSSERHGGRQNDRVVGHLDGEDWGPRGQPVDRGSEAAADTAIVYGEHGGQAVEAATEHGPPPRPQPRGGDRSTPDADISGGETRVDARHPRERVRVEPVGSAPPVTDTDGERSKQRWPVTMEPELSTAADCRPAAGFGHYAPAIQRWERTIGRPAPDPTDDRGLRPGFVEWMMGLPDGHVCALGLSRTAELKMLGNGVVPAQAALALRLLDER